MVTGRVYDYFSFCFFLFQAVRSVIYFIASPHSVSFFNALITYILSRSSAGKSSAAQEVLFFGGVNVLTWAVKPSVLEGPKQSATQKKSQIQERHEFDWQALPAKCSARPLHRWSWNTDGWICDVESLHPHFAQHVYSKSCEGKSSEHLSLEKRIKYLMFLKWLRI